MNKLFYLATFIISMSFLLVVACSNTNNKTISESSEEGIELKWKLSKIDSIKYKTVMTQIGESTFEMDYGDFFNNLIDSTETEKEDSSKEFFKKLKDSYTNTNLITILSNSMDFKSVINIETIAEEQKENKPNKKDDVDNMMNSLMKGTMLRGSVNSNGSLHSFWVKRAQKNLLSLFFELPNKTIKKGDTWTLYNVNLIGNDQNFICKKAEKRNIITLSDIKKSNSETIAVIDYDIMEYVQGDFNTPAFFGNESSTKKTTMKLIYKAQAEFSVEQGKWISYNGIMSLDANGVINSVQKQKYALIEQ